MLCSGISIRPLGSGGGSAWPVGGIEERSDKASQTPTVMIAKQGLRLNNSAKSNPVLLQFSSSLPLVGSDYND